MASLQKRGDRHYLQFIFHGKRHTIALGKVGDEEAANKAAQGDYLLMRIKQRLVMVPIGVDVTQFIEWDGKVPETEKSAQGETSLEQLRTQYIKTHENGRSKR